MNKEAIGIQSPPPRRRNFSLDLLRILSMWMVVCLHSLNYGGILEAASAKNYYALLLIWNTCIIAVNLYILISGYFLCTQKFRPSKLLRLYIEVVFWCAVGYAFGIFSGIAEFSVKTLLLEVLCPFSSKQYWFVSAYVILYLLSPILNFLIQKLNKEQHLAICIGLLVIFSLWVDLYPHNNYFDLNRGYSFTWFIVLYFVGSYLRLRADPKKWKLPALWYLLLTLIVSGIQTLLPEVFAAINLPNLWNGHFTEYNSIFMTLSTVFLFVAFLKSDIKRKIPQKLIAFFAPLTFGVYLIHENPYFKDYLWFTLLKTKNLPGDKFYLVPLSFGIITAVFLGCALLDFLRSLFFMLWEKQTFWRKALDRFDAFTLGCFSKLASRLSEKL